MQMVYNSESYAVVQFDVPAEITCVAQGDLTRGGYEIVDKFARKELFIEGALAEYFKIGVQALINTSPSQEELDDYIARYTSLMHQPVVLH